MKNLKLSPKLFALILLVSSPCIGICAWFYITWGNSYYICFNTLAPSHSDVENSAYLQFPPSAESIEYDANGVNRKAGCTIWVRFEMDSADYAEFEQTTQVENFSDTIRLNGDGFDFFSQKKGWTQPQSSLAGEKAFLGVTTVYENQWVFIDTGNSDKWIVYLITNKEWV